MSPSPQKRSKSRGRKKSIHYWKLRTLASGDFDVSRLTVRQQVAFFTAQAQSGASGDGSQSTLASSPFRLDRMLLAEEQAGKALKSTLQSPQSHKKKPNLEETPSPLQRQATKQAVPSSPLARRTAKSAKKPKTDGLRDKCSNDHASYDKQAPDAGPEAVVTDIPSTNARKHDSAEEYQPAAIPLPTERKESQSALSGGASMPNSYRNYRPKKTKVPGSKATLIGAHDIDAMHVAPTSVDIRSPLSMSADSLSCHEQSIVQPSLACSALPNTATMRRFTGNPARPAGAPIPIGSMMPLYAQVAMYKAACDAIRQQRLAQSAS